MNGIGGERGVGQTPIIDGKQIHPGLNINMSARDTVVLALLCSVFIIAGAATYNTRNCRWLVAVGGSGLGELLLRWVLELCLPTSRLWGIQTFAGQL